MQHLLEQHPFIKSLLQLNAAHTDRATFHKEAAPLLKEMGDDKAFIAQIIQRNFADEGYLNQPWSLYNIPFFFGYEIPDFNLKVHLFVPLENRKEAIAASCIHHHNNYMLSTYAMHGSGYETYLFEKNFEIDAQLYANLKIANHFHQKDRPVSFVDAWEPHLVFNPTKLSATIVLWSPDKKRATDQLKHNPVLKAIKNPLRKVANVLGLSNKLGLASEKTYQFYPEGNKIKGILEDEFFEPTRKAVGPDIDNYAIQTVFRFIQEGNFLSADYLKEKRKTLPAYYQPFIDMYLQGDPIPETFAKAKINIPQQGFTKQDVLAAVNG